MFFFYRVLLEAIKYCVQNPDALGKTFLRLERDFDVYSEYYVSEPKAQEIISSCSDFFLVTHTSKLYLLYYIIITLIK